MKRPAFQFYPADWKKDPALSICSITARGLWIELMCLAHESQQYGVLSVNGSAMTDVQVSRLVGESLPVVKKALKELEDAGVFSRDGNGAIFSRRMVKDENLRKVRADGGEKGKDFGQLGAEHGKKGGRPKKERGVSEAPLKPAPSSSSSSSSSSSEYTPVSPFEETEEPPLCTLEQALRYAATGQVRMSPKAVEYWWHNRNASGWRRGGSGNPKIRSWQSDMATSAPWAEEASQKAPPAAGEWKPRFPGEKPPQP